MPNTSATYCRPVKMDRDDLLPDYYRSFGHNRPTGAVRPGETRGHV